VEKEYKFYDGTIFWKYPCPRCIGGSLTWVRERGFEPSLHCINCGYDHQQQKNFEKFERKWLKKARNQLRKQKKRQEKGVKKD